MKNLIFGIIAMVVALSSSAFTNSSKLINKQFGAYYVFTNVNMLAPYSTYAVDYQYLPLAGCSTSLNAICEAVWLEPTDILPALGSHPTGTYIEASATGYSIYP
ncbi:MAG: hypothetical protein P0Y49_16545 [Candidatus Pedobacter colombiensis]|uniref:Uncharacterized protein n=1 Tax=Candidatus Pedobacter colombiensis TaxID=3121371 RepID=A0AAJ5W7B1_9SPHI|nr:hypothetical protein [Pedobacter sp.]WEK18400.1 MAG: hypothetical protein P0Y49_16545 [Pedobacter sp.]